MRLDESKKQTKKHKNPCRSSLKILSKNRLRVSKNIDLGAMLQAGLRDGRQPRCPLSLGERPAPAVEGE